MTGLTAESLSAMIEAVVPEMYVVIAKNSVVGMDSIAIAELLGVSLAEVQEVQADETFKACRLIIASRHAETLVDSDFNWDDIESTALKGLAKRVPFEKDTDMLLKIAAVANKAQRRANPNKNNVLDPSQGGARVPLTLTSRIVERLQRDGSREIETTRQISVVDGSAINPKFEDIDSLLGVSRKPRIAENMQVTTHEPDFTVEDLQFNR